MVHDGNRSPPVAARDAGTDLRYSCPAGHKDHALTGQFQRANLRTRVAAAEGVPALVADREAPLRRRSRALATVGALSLASACGGPVGPFAGGELSGDVSEPPAQWGSVPDAIQLEVRPGQPYSVNLWSVALGRNLYIATGREDSAWRDHLDVDNNVRVRVDGKVYELQVVAVDDHEERQRVVDAYMRKYADEEAEGFAPVRKRRQSAMHSALDEHSGVIFRLTPR